MNIAVMTPTYLPIVGGAEVGIFEIYRRLSHHHRVTIYTPELPGRESYHSGEEPYFVDERLNIVRYHDRLRWSALPNRMVPLMNALTYNHSVGAFETARSLPMETDVVNCHYFFQNFGAIRCLVGRGLPVVVSVIGREFDKMPRFTPSWLYARAVFARCAAVIYISNYMQTVVGIRGRNEHVVPYGVDTGRYAPGLPNRQLLENHGVPPGAKVIFTVQRLSRVKRIDILLDAFAVVLKKMPSALLLIGGTGGDMLRLKKHAVSIAISGSVRWCGYIPETHLPEYYRLADVVAFHSLNETFGVVIPQAFASGKPLVTIRCTALQEVVQDGETGLLAAPGDPVDLADKIYVLLEDRGRASSLGNTAAAYSRQYFSWDTIADRYESVLTSVSARGIHGV